MVVGELFFSAFLQVLFDKLASPDLLNFARREGVHSRIKKWEKSLLMIQAVLSDAEEKQLTEKHVKMWLDDLQDMAYDVEDMVDEFAIEALAAERGTAGTSKVWNLIPFCFTSLSPIAVKFNVSMRSKLKDITSRLEEISKQRIELVLELLKPTGANFSVIPIVGYMAWEVLVSLTFIVKGQLPLSLKYLSVRNCEKLQYLLDDREDASTSSSSVTHKENINHLNTSLLENLNIYNCSSLTCLSTRGQLPDVKYLQICYCSNLKTLSSRGHLPATLENLVILCCLKLDSIAERFCNNRSIERICIKRCANLRSIHEGLHSLSSLREIYIEDCPSPVFFPEGGLPDAYKSFNQ